jgi:hypothetical protein
VSALCPSSSPCQSANHMAPTVDWQLLLNDNKMHVFCRFVNFINHLTDMIKYIQEYYTVKPKLSVTTFSGYFFLNPIQSPQGITFLHFVNFDLINHPHLVYDIFNLPELILQFSVIVTKILIHIFSLLEIIPTRSLCSFHVIT